MFFKTMPCGAAVHDCIQEVPNDLSNAGEIQLSEDFQVIQRETVVRSRLVGLWFHSQSNTLEEFAIYKKKNR